MHYYKRNIGDYAKKAGRLSMLQHGSYTLLIDACYDREQFPTLEEAIEWTWASTTEEIEAVTFILRKFFTLIDGVYIQNRIKEEIEDYHNKSETNKRIAIDRETKRKEKSTNRVQGVNEPPPNHKPLYIKTGGEPPDEVFGYGLEFLTRKGVTEKNARTFLGMQLKKCGEENLVAALESAMREDAIEPIAYISGVIKHQATKWKPGTKRPMKDYL